jgi:NAD(P)-dependent dehydrogenase (short-subunit alcohol dehydrogenase family)
VAATLRRPERLDDLKKTYGDRLWTAQLDVTDHARVREVVTDAFDALGTIDVVVNNAGYGLFAAVEEPSDEQIQRVIDTDLIGSIAVIRAALPHLRSQGHGHIVQISSAGGQAAYAGFSAYHAAKWGIEGFCETVALEVAPFNIGVTIVEPGATSTGFSDAVVRAKAIEDYDKSPAGQARKAIDSGTFVFPNDRDKVVAAIIDTVKSDSAPLRLPLGVDTYKDIDEQLTSRLREHEAHKDIALSVVTDD